MTKQTINKYFRFVTKIEDVADTRTMYHIGDRFIIEVSRIFPDLKNPDSLMNIWKKWGYIPAVLPSYLVVRTYFTDISGNCWGWYNITEKTSEGGKRRVIDFDYLLEATPENEKRLVAECIRMREMDIRPHKIQRESLSFPA